MAEYARREINSIGGYYAYGKELVNGDSIFDYDVTKLSVYTRDIGLAGIEVYDLLRDEYDIQIEFGDISNILAYISIGDRIQDIERLVGALDDIERLYKKRQLRTALWRVHFSKGCYVPAESVLLREGLRSGGSVFRKSLCGVCDVLSAGNPDPGAGEMITDDVVQYILYAKKKGCSMQGTEDPAVDHLMVLANI